MIDTDCRPDRVCSFSTLGGAIRKCVNPCATGACGVDAQCYVNNHNTVCVCPDGYEGDPFKICSKRPPPRPPGKSGALSA